MAGIPKGFKVINAVGEVSPCLECHKGDLPDCRLACKRLGDYQEQHKIPPFPCTGCSKKTDDCKDDCGKLESYMDKSRNSLISRASIDTAAGSYQFGRVFGGAW